MALRVSGHHFARYDKAMNHYVVLATCLVLVLLPACLLANNHTDPFPTSKFPQTSTKARIDGADGRGTTDNGTRYEDGDARNVTTSEEPSGEPEDIVSRFLIYLDYIERSSNCEAGTWAVTLDKGATSYGPNRYMKQAMKTVETANFFTRIWRSKALKGVQHNEEFFFNVVASNVENDDDIFAFGNCYDAYEFLDYNIYCPYAYRLPNGGGIRVKDLSLAYPYLTNVSEWFYEARMNANKLLDKRRTVNSKYSFISK